MPKSKKHKPLPKRLDGKKKLVPLTAQIEQDMRSYCREKGIDSECEFIRQAIVKYMDSDYDDNTLKLTGLKDVREHITQLKDMISVLFNYLHRMHLNLLAYHPEIAEELKDAAYASASNRHEKFLAGFRKRLQDDPAFFERLLHAYVAGTLDE